MPVHAAYMRFAEGASVEHDEVQETQELDLHFPINLA
jgi:hypothetical protein